MRLAGTVDDYGTRVFYKNAEAKNTVIVNRGGARSSKSYSIMQLFLTRFMKQRKKKFLLVRKTFPALRISLHLLWKDLLNKWRLVPAITEEKQIWNYTYGGNVLHFASLDDPEKIKSTDWNYIWMEEANEFTYEDYQVLKLRLSAQETSDVPNQLFMSFNPIDAFHWIKERVIEGNEDALEIKSTYRDNPFLSPAYRKLILQLRDQDPNFWAIYGLGEWGRLTNLIYTNWDLVDAFPADDTLDTFYGVDFGFNAPSVLLKLVVKDQEVWEEELLYEAGLTNSDLIKRMTELIPEDQRQLPMYADSAEPARIDEIYDAGFNIHPAEKAVKDGIDFVKRFRTHVVRGSENVLKEKRAYSWRQDKNGRVLDEPVKWLDHAMDAERYGVYSHLNGLVPGVFVLDAVL